MEAWLGVRPEDVALVPPDDGGLTATVETVEDLGASGLVRLTLGRERVSALVGRDRPARGAVAGVRLRLDNTSLFDVAGLREASPLSEPPATSKNDAAPIVKPRGLCLG